VKQGNKWVAMDPDGKVHGKHLSDAACKKQARAINMKLSDVILGEGFKDLELSDEGDELSFEKEIIYVGEFADKDGNEFTVTEQDVYSWVDSTTEMLADGINIPIPKEHTFDPASNLGHVSEIQAREDSKGRLGVFAKMDFEDKESKKVALSNNVSLYKQSRYEAGNKKTYDNVIRHVAVTSYPRVPDLEGFEFTVALSEAPRKKVPSPKPPITGDSDMGKLQDLASKLNLNLSDSATEDDIVTAIYEAKTKTEPPKEVKLSDFPSVFVKSVKRNRELELGDLVKEGHITKATYDKLSKQYTSDNNMTLVLSEVDDGFDSIVEALKENKAIEMSDLTGSQKLPRDWDNPEKNLLLKNIEKRRAAANLSN
jgi:hypothetical protein